MVFSILRAPVVQKATGLPKSSFYAQIAEGLLPPPIRMGKRSVGWLESEINAIVFARAKGQSDEEIRSLVKQLVEQRKNIEQKIKGETYDR